MRPGVFIGGAVMVVLAGFGLFAPILDGYSITAMGELCRTIQDIAGLLDLVGILGVFDPDDVTGGQCSVVHNIILGLYGLGATGLVMLVVGAVIGRPD